MSANTTLEGLNSLAMHYYEKQLEVAIQKYAKSREKYERTRIEIENTKQQYLATRNAGFDSINKSLAERQITEIQAQSLRADYANRFDLLLKVIETSFEGLSGREREIRHFKTEIDQLSENCEQLATIQKILFSSNL